MRPLIWWEVRFWNKNENTWGVGSYHSKSSFLGVVPGSMCPPSRPARNDAPRQGMCGG